MGWFWLTGGRYVATDNAYVQADTSASRPTSPAWSSASRSRTTSTVTRGPGAVHARRRDLPQRPGLGRGRDAGWPRPSSRRCRRATPRAQAEIEQGARATSRSTRRSIQRQQDLASRRVSAAGAARCRAPRSRRRAQPSWRRCSSSRPASRPSSTATRRRRSSGIRAIWRPWRRATGRARSRPHRRAGLDRRHDGARSPSLQPGEYLEAGQAAFALVATDHVWIEANPKETDLTYVRPGQPVDGVGRHLSRPGVARARSQSVSPASQAQFSLLPAQNTSGNWVKVVQRIPLRVAVEPEAGRAAAARRHERRDRGRHRPPAPPARPVRLAVAAGLAHGRDRPATHVAATGRSRSA